MQVLFESRVADGGRLRAVAVRRLRFALRRLGWLVPRARVLLSDVNGPRGGVDKRCQIEFRTARDGTVVITSMSRDWHGALDAAIARASRVLVRLWQRGREHRRGPGRDMLTRRLQPAPIPR